MLNQCNFIGNLGRDPEVRTLANGGRVVNLSLAVTEKWKGADGEQQERTEWVRVTIWNEKLGEIAGRYLTKGARCYLSGALQTRKWVDQSGVEKYTTEIVLQRFRGELVLLGGGDRDGGSTASRADDELDTEIPF